MHTSAADIVFDNIEPPTPADLIRRRAQFLRAYLVPAEKPVLNLVDYTVNFSCLFSYKLITQCVDGVSPRALIGDFA